MRTKFREEDAIVWYLTVLDLLLNPTTFVVCFQRKSGCIRQPSTCASGDLTFDAAAGLSWQRT